MQVSYIDAKDAPADPAKINQRTEAILEILGGITNGFVAKVTPNGQTPRGVKMSFVRVAAKRGIKITTWSVPGDAAVYIKRL